MKSTITSPKSFFGYQLGADREMARWDEIVRYFDLLGSESDRVRTIHMGPSTEGNPFLEVIITSPENFENLEEIRRISMTLADPRGLSQEEIDSLVQKGKAVCVQSMSLHATEIGGTQMAPLLAYDMAVADDPDTLRILNEVVFIMIPCFNPDGEIMVTDFYKSTIGTPYEGCHYPILYHKYTGHDNNRDAFAQNIVESRYMGQILFHEWMPQAYQDHHHMGSNGARIFIAPYKNPLRPGVDPLVWRELNLYGAGMAYHMESEGLDGVTSGAQYPSWGHFGYHWITNSHNIPGMLTESASAKLASPLYIDPSSLQGDGDNFMPEYEAQTNFPSPWKGGWWHLSDIMDRQYAAAYGLLDVMAKNREAILANMARKALNQTERGALSETQAYIIPAHQFDQSTYRKLVKILLGQGIEVQQAKSDFTVSNRLYKAGDLVVFLAQPKFGLINSLLGETHYPDNIWTRDKDGALTAFDSATDTVAEFMGVQVDVAGAPVCGEFSVITEVPEADAWQEALERGAKSPGAAHDEPVESGKPFGYVLSARENDAYAVANAAKKAGCQVWRIDACPYRDFYVEGDEAVIRAAWEKTPVEVRKAGRPQGLTEVKPARVAIYQRYYGGNAEEGWMRLLLETFGFDFTSVKDADIWGGCLKDFDVLVLPSDMPAVLEGPALHPEGFMYTMSLSQPPEYRSGLGKEGAEKIREFVQGGGKLLAMEGSADYAISTLDLPVRNIVKGMKAKDFNTHGSTLRVSVNAQHPLAYGMPEKTLILHWNGPVFDVTDKFHADQYDTVVRFEKDHLLRSGLLTGEKIIAGRSVMMQAPCGKGFAVLYGFAPSKRMQTHATFKLLMNALYV